MSLRGLATMQTKVCNLVAAFFLLSSRGFGVVILTVDQKGLLLC